MSTKAKTAQRMCFVEDDDGHTYLIPVDQRKAFEVWMEAGPFWEGYKGPEFNDASIGCSTSCYSFLDPREDQ